MLVSGFIWDEMESAIGESVCEIVNGLGQAEGLDRCACFEGFVAMIIVLRWDLELLDLTWA